VSPYAHEDGVSPICLTVGVTISMVPTRLLTFHQMSKKRTPELIRYRTKLLAVPTRGSEWDVTYQKCVGILVFRGVMEPMSKPREYTREEIRKMFLDHFTGMIAYWEKETRVESVHDKLHGLAFSILTALDGGAADLPGFKVVPCPHPSDKEYHRQHGENWFPEDTDIGGSLHEEFCQRGR